MMYLLEHMVDFKNKTHEMWNSEGNNPDGEQETGFRIHYRSSIA